MDKRVESFSWSEEEKEYYFAQAESRLTKAKVEEEIDREKFKIDPNGVTIFLKPFRKGTKKAQARWNRLKKVRGFGETYINQLDGKKESRMYHGQIRIPWRDLEKERRKR